MKTKPTTVYNQHTFPSGYVVVILDTAERQSWATSWFRGKHDAEEWISQQPAGGIYQVFTADEYNDQYAPPF